MQDHMITSRNSRVLVVHSSESESDAFGRMAALIENNEDAAKFAGRSAAVVATNFSSDFEGDNLVYTLAVVVEEVE